MQLFCLDCDSDSTEEGQLPCLTPEQFKNYKPKLSISFDDASDDEYVFVVKPTSRTNTTTNTRTNTKSQGHVTRAYHNHRAINNIGWVSFV